MTTSDKELSKFFAEAPLYSKLDLYEIQDYEEAFSVFDYFGNKAYKFYCPVDKEHHTFKFQRKSGPQYLIIKNQVPTSYLENEGKINISFNINSTCQMCGFRMDFLLNISSENTYLDDTFINLILKKIGQWPPFERIPESEVFNYLTEEDKSNYKKALSNLSVSYGIGAFAYFRRIIENEIKRLVKDISELEYENADKVKQAWTTYESNHQMSNLIESINSFLPKSFNELGYNPIKALHQQTSGGLHEFSEEVCLEKAKDVDKLLRYVIKNVSTLKFDYLEAKNAIKNLTK